MSALDNSFILHVEKLNHISIFEVLSMARCTQYIFNKWLLFLFFGGSFL